MKYKIIIGLCAFFLPICIWGQGISGQVKDLYNHPISQATVMLYSVDSVYKETVVCDDEGRFQLKTDIKPYRLLVQHISYTTLSVVSSDSVLNNLVLEDKAEVLGEVVVKAERPIMKMRNGGLVFNPQTLSKARLLATAFDLLCETPGVQSFDKETISMVGTGVTPTILINGKPSTMSTTNVLNYIKSLPSNRVKEIEVNYNPPANWNVKGTAINIVLTESLSDFMTGQVQSKWQNKHADSFNENASVMFSKGKFSADFIYSLDYGKSLTEKNTWIKHDIQGETIDLTSNTKRKGSTPYSHNIYVGLKYNLPSNQYLSLTYNNSLIPSAKSEMVSYNSLLGNTLQSTQNKTYLHNVSLDYMMPKGWRLGMEYLYFNTKQDYTGYVINKHTEYSQYQRINKYNAFLSGHSAINKSWSLGYGANYTHTSSNSGQPTLKSTLYNEDYAKIYADAEGNILNGKLYLRGTLAVDWYKIKEYKEWSFMPSFSLTYNIAPQHQLMSSFQTFRLYPNYWLRQDFIQQVDGYEVKVGNPTLKVAKYNIASLYYIFKQKYYLSISYYHVKDAFFTQHYQSPENLQLINQIANIDLSKVFTIYLNVPFTIANKWYLTFTPSAFHEYYKTANWHDLSFKVSGWSTNITVNSQLVLSSEPRLTFITKAFAGTAQRQGILKTDGVWFVDAGLQLSMLKDKLNIGFYANDIFESATLHYGTHFMNQWSETQNCYNRGFSLTLTYKFSNYKEKNRKKVDTSRMGIDNL